MANEVYLLYLAQPLVAIMLAGLVLRERRHRSYWPLALLALAGVYLIVFQDDATAPFSALPHGRIEAALLVLSAVALWGSGTVLGRYALRAVSPMHTATLRFVIALPVLLVLLLIDRGSAAFSGYAASQLPSLLGIALIPGVIAMLLYYRALRGTPASTATIAELAYPAALFLAFSLPEPVGLGTPLHPVAIVGTACLVVAVTSLTMLRSRAVALPRGRAAQPAPASP
ncbi:MAG: DMT family transporter [Candidatus Dormibacteraeota bacterium]|nr:DMT family transporter [Candidatus Dormibacteraeota bacterium]